MTRWIAAAVAALTMALPATAAPDPEVVVQARPPGYMLDLAKAFSRKAAGEVGLEEFQKTLETKLGEKGFTGLDMLRPIAAYAHLDAKFEQSWIVAVVPITDEKEFIALGERLKLTAKPVAGKAGLYAIAPTGDDVPGDLPIRLRFHDRHAYLGYNAKDDVLDAKALVPVAKLVDPAEAGLVAVRLDGAKLDPAAKKLALEKVEGLIAEGMQLAGTGPGGDALSAVLKAISTFAKDIVADGQSATGRLLATPKSVEVGYEIELVGKPDSKLAKGIAAYKPTLNRFAGLMTPDAVAGGVMTAPLIAPELRDGLAAVFAGLAKEGLPDIANFWKTLEVFQPVLKVAFGVLAKSAKENSLNAGVALFGPHDDGLYTAIAGLTVADPRGVEKALREALPKAPKEEIQDTVKLDAFKVGEVSVHTILVDPYVPPQVQEIQKVFGNTAKLHVAFGPDAIFFAIGPKAVEELTRAIALKPQAAKLLEMNAHSKRILNLVKLAGGDEAAKGFEAVLGTDDEMVSINTLEVEGGTRLSVRYTAWSGSWYVPGMMFFGGL